MEEFLIGVGVSTIVGILIAVSGTATMSSEEFEDKVLDTCDNNGGWEEFEKPSLSSKIHKVVCKYGAVFEVSE